jgi:cytochrome-b5 reductase
VFEHRRRVLTSLRCCRRMEAVTNFWRTAIAGAVAVSVLTLLALVLRLRGRSKFLQHDRFQAAQLIEKETITHNTSRYRFSLGAARALGLPIGQHISFKYEDAGGKEVLRSYTPVSGNDSKGYADFVIKVRPA